jgi:hypothetical protein
LDQKTNPGIYDALDNLRKTKVLQNGTYVTKQETKVNYLGLTSEVIDGENRKQYFKYDDFSGLKELRFVDNLSTAPKKTAAYSFTTDYSIRTNYDENNKTIEETFDKVGNLIKQKRATSETKFYYNQINQLDSVSTPAGKKTYYRI